MEVGMMNYRLIYGLTSIMLLFFISCDSDDKVTSGSIDKEINNKTNLPPTSITLTASADTVSVCDLLNLNCLVEDPENDSLTYEWSSYRLTENSTLDNYQVIYWLNHGEFSGTDKDVVWKPGRIAGPYLILCNVKDKAGYEITGKKILQVVSTECMSVLTDKITYRSSDFDSIYHNLPWPHLKFSYTVTNNLDLKANLYGCDMTITPGLQKKISNQWSQSIKPDGCQHAFFTGDQIRPEFIRVEVFAGEEVQDSLWSPYLGWETFEPSQYRLFITYSLGPYLGGALTDTLYSNEFEVIE
jgi:hypothetical protein